MPDETQQKLCATCGREEMFSCRYGYCKGVPSMGSQSRKDGELPRDTDAMPRQNDYMIRVEVDVDLELREAYRYCREELSRAPWWAFSTRARIQGAMVGYEFALMRLWMRKNTDKHKPGQIIIGSPWLP